MAAPIKRQQECGLCHMHHAVVFRAPSLTEDPVILLKCPKCDTITCPGCRRKVLQGKAKRCPACEKPLIPE